MAFQPLQGWRQVEVTERRLKILLIGSSVLSITLEGRIDALTLQEQFWLVIVEGKRGGFNVLQAVPQTLAYMSTTPHPERPVFGLVTNGYDYLFVKLVRQDRQEFALFHNFTLLSDENSNLFQVARVLKHLVGMKRRQPDLPKSSVKF